MQGFALLTNKFSIYSLVLQKSLTQKWACFPPNQNVYFFQIAEKSRIQTIHYSICKNILLKVFRGTFVSLITEQAYSINNTAI